MQLTLQASREIFVPLKWGKFNFLQLFNPGKILLKKKKKKKEINFGSAEMLNEYNVKPST
jgi:hypothetical protein